MSSEATATRPETSSAYADCAAVGAGVGGRVAGVTRQVRRVSSTAPTAATAPAEAGTHQDRPSPAGVPARPAVIAATTPKNRTGTVHRRGAPGVRPGGSPPGSVP